MPNPGFARDNGSGRTVIGPVYTAFGFQCWYLVCFQDVMIAVPQGFWRAAAIAYSYSGKTLIVIPGALKQVLLDLITGPGLRLRRQVPAKLAYMPDSQLHARPNITIPISQLNSIVLRASKAARAGGIVTPEIVVETKTGKKQIYGINPPEFKLVSAQLPQLYPQLCKSV